MKKGVVLSLMILSLIDIVLGVSLSLNEQRIKSNVDKIIETKDKNYDIDNREGIYSYLLKEDEENYTLVLSNNANDIDENILASSIKYVDNNYSMINYNEVTNDYRIVGPKWIEDENIDKITKVIIKDKIFPTKTSFWFVGYKNLKSIEGLYNIDFSNVTNTSGMFSGCSSLTTLDLSSFNMKNVTDTSNMFAFCNNLQVILVDSNIWDVSNVIQSDNMFLNDINLVGTNDFGYESSIVDATYAKIGNNVDSYLIDIKES